MYAIVDIETTGNGYTGMKITEISVFRYDGTRVVDEFTTLVNPETNIPPFITSLTGISNAMVAHAPKFYEVAKQVQEITEGAVFVAHSVNFDYNIIKNEFKELGFDFSRKKLCTVRLSRRLLPGHKSYSLGVLCERQGIPINGRHRARGDAEATVTLFEQLLELDGDQSVFRSFLNPRSRHATLPPLLPQERFEQLPETEGVYYFKDQDKRIIYVGKANNIKQRVLSHFYDKAKKEINMCMETADISCTTTGSELLALLLESSEIKHWWPKYNRAQRRSRESLGLFSYTDQAGIVHLAYGRLQQVERPLRKFYNVQECRNFLERLCQEYELCPKYCGLQTGSGACFHYQIKECKGICRGSEAVESYNLRAQRAIASLEFDADNFLIKEKGRTKGEIAFVWVQRGVYKGYGYTRRSDIEQHPDEIRAQLLPQKDNKDIRRILDLYLRQNPEAVVPLKSMQVRISHEMQQHPEVSESGQFQLFAS